MTTKKKTLKEIKDIETTVENIEKAVEDVKAEVKSYDENEDLEIPEDSELILQNRLLKQEINSLKEELEKLKNPDQSIKSENATILALQESNKDLREQIINLSK